MPCSTHARVLQTCSLLLSLSNQDVRLISPVELWVEKFWATESEWMDREDLHITLNHHSYCILGLVCCVGGHRSYLRSSGKGTDLCRVRPDCCTCPMTCVFLEALWVRLVNLQLLTPKEEQFTVHPERRKAFMKHRVNRSVMLSVVTWLWRRWG